MQIQSSLRNLTPSPSQRGNPGVSDFSNFDADECVKGSSRNSEISFDERDFSSKHAHEISKASVRGARSRPGNGNDGRGGGRRANERYGEPVLGFRDGGGGDHNINHDWSEDGEEKHEHDLKDLDSFWSSERFQLQTQAVSQKDEHDRKSKVFDQKAIYSPEDLERYLQYQCYYKRHKGKSWKEVREIDPQYFIWCLVNRMRISTKTWAVFANLLTEKQRMRAIERTKENAQFIKKKRKTQTLLDDDPSVTDVLTQERV